MNRLRAAALAALLILGVPASAVEPARERIPYRQDDGELGDLLVRVVLVMGGIAIVGGGALWVLRKRGHIPGAAGGSARAVRLVETLRLGPRSGLLVVEFGQRRLLLGRTETGISVLANDPAEAVVPPAKDVP